MVVLRATASHLARRIVSMNLCLTMDVPLRSYRGSPMANPDEVRLPDFEPARIDLPQSHLQRVGPRHFRTGFGEVRSGTILR
jgi:hypothetical protein